jgi:hypothetical protein
MVDLAVERGQQIVRRFRVPLSISTLRDVLASVPGRKELVFEEGPMAQWLFRNLRDCVDRLVVCDPWRNHLIAQDGDRDDPIDAADLARLLRGGYLREVHHSEDEEHVEFKRWVGLYNDRVREAVRQINKVRGRLRMYGLRPPRGAVKNVAVRQRWLEELRGHPGAAPLKLLWDGYDACRQQVAQARQQMVRRCRKYPIIAAWQELDGMGPVRAAVLLAYLETPWRWGGNDRKLWKYCGVGLERSGSGKDKAGRPQVGHQQLAWRVNRQLKSAVLGAARNAIDKGGNVFAEQYDRLRERGVEARNAWHGVARKMLSVMWAMWKTGTRFDPGWVNGVGGSPRRSFGPAPAAEAAPAIPPARRPAGRRRGP